MSICIITGSTLGGAEYVADHIEQVLITKGLNVELFNNATLDDIKNKLYLLVVTSTHGAGELPDNIQPLFEEIEKSTVDFSEMNFGVIGLGSSDYDTFCYAVDTVERILQQRGAKKLCDSLKIDVIESFDHDETAEEWLPNFIDKL
ncbi:FMN-binding protein MioC [Phocoenobacter skyensis]|uniref:FMN-binding protein MioC n=1 Tax=Phocoenobacter skyensis TaxID=97481 RepID=A0A1H7WS34_9PAST|nr:FMN-binding protein MioC [Pasteurella skyensis]MDP8079026.1 FMN-binding protein MioC [Pasteurella skyensis]MDP8084976.1 FMN-binding protein MioC [Pasteurella skyensis]MDP8163500.1 FMN-binding protein MioC [Pasteurella skyensis]MDP8173820.1 FMN-binding protein MioC [Pasteurella skyensis]MDP8177885.1 FMN-binding protein MioC [Pasteurella skyensis]